MDRRRNPYSPGPGRRPSALAGRDAEIDAWEVGLERLESGLDTNLLGLYGLRGVGKTVLLHDLARRARARDWITVVLEAGSGSLRESLAVGLHSALALAKKETPGARFTRAVKTMMRFRAHVTATVDATGNTVFGIDLTSVDGGAADSGNLDADLEVLILDVARAAQEQGVGLAILIDEAQDLDREELGAIARSQQRVNQEAVPAQIALAGLPNLLAVMSEARTYSERFDFRRIEGLTVTACDIAIREPAERAGVEWEDDAVAFVTAQTKGYPYFLQQYSQDSWNAAADNVVTVRDARNGAEVSVRELDAGFFRSRWDRATEAERDFLRAMATDGDGPSQSGEVAARMGRATSSLGPARANLIAKGLVYAPEHGKIAFTVPGMADFVQRQPRT